MEEATRLFQENIQSTSQKHDPIINQDSSPSSSNAATPENIKKVENDIDKCLYTPKDKRLMIICNELALQLELFWPFLESITIQALDYTKKLYELQSKLKLWQNFRGLDPNNLPTVPEATNALLPDLQPLEYYVPGNIKI